MPSVTTKLASWPCPDFRVRFCGGQDVMPWLRFPHYWPFERIIYWSPGLSPHNAEVWCSRGVSLNCCLTYCRVAGDLRRSKRSCDVTVQRKNPYWTFSLVNLTNGHYGSEETLTLINRLFKGWGCICWSWSHDDVIKWKHFPRYWPFVRGIHRSRWIPHTKASDAELWCFLWSASE